MTVAAVRLGTTTDLPDVMHIMSRAFDPRFGEAWNEAQCLAMIAASGCRLVTAHTTEAVGFALSRTVVDTCELMLLAVVPEARQCGTGRLLLDDIVAAARSAGAASVFLEMRQGNPAERLYSRYGFKQVGKRNNYYRGASGEVLDALTYRYLLS